MGANDISLRLVDMTLPLSALAYLMLAAAMVIFAIRFRAWSAVVCGAGFTYIAAVKIMWFVWSFWDALSPNAPYWLDMLARFQLIALLLSAVALVFFAVTRKSRRDPDSRDAHGIEG